MRDRELPLSSWRFRLGGVLVEFSTSIDGARCTGIEDRKGKSIVRDARRLGMVPPCLARYVARKPRRMIAKPRDLALDFACQYCQDHCELTADRLSVGTNSPPDPEAMHERRRAHGARFCE
jgi:hypothetical protein